ncbi:MAG: NnrU family protein [Rhizobiaceae bacterium]
MNLAILILGLVLFLAVHSVRMLAPQWRERQIASLGKNAWQGIYSVLSLASLATVIVGFAWYQPEAPILYIPPVWARHLAFLLMAIALISFMVGNFPSGRLKPMLKHPMLLAVIIWAFTHLLVNGDLASVLLFGSLLAWSVWNRISISRRIEAIPEKGPVIYDLAAIVSGLVIWALFLWKIHEWLIGVPLVIA